MKRYLIFLLLFITSFTLYAKDYYCVTAKVLNVRSQPSKNCVIVGNLKKGDIVSAESEAYNGWIKVSTSSITGYVSTSYLRFSHNEEEHSEKKQVTPLEETYLKVKDTLDSINLPYIDEPLMTFIIVILLMIQFGTVRSEFKEKPWIPLILLVVLSVVELYYLFMEDVTPLWFCESFEVGWFGCIIGFLGFALFMYGQYVAILETLCSLNNKSGVYINWVWGILSWIIAIIVTLILSIFEVGFDGFLIFGIIFVVYQLFFCLYVLFINVLKGRILDGFLQPLLYLFIMIPFVALLTLLMALVVIVAIFSLFAGGVLGGSSSSSGSNGSNVILEDGTELIKTGINRYRDHNGHYWSRDGNRFTREDN